MGNHPIERKKIFEDKMGNTSEEKGNCRVIGQYVINVKQDSKEGGLRITEYSILQT